MIKNIHIGNYALIDKTNIGLEKGFTIITGETGAGKSILLGAIGLTLGQRADVATKFEMREIRVRLPFLLARLA